MTIIYEVTIGVNKSQVEKFNEVILSHVQQIVSLENGKLFSNATISKLVKSDEVIDNSTEVCIIQYNLPSLEALQIYHSQYAQKLVKEALSQLGFKPNISHRVYSLQTQINP